MFSNIDIFCQVSGIYLTLISDKKRFPVAQMPY